MNAPLARFTITPNGDHYRIGFTLQDGGTMELIASFEQLDAIAEEIDRRLDMDEEERVTLRG